MSENGYRRRDVLKKSAIAATIPMASQSASSKVSTARVGTGGDIAITDQSGMSPEKVNEDVQTIAKHNEVQTLASHIEDETGFQLDKESAAGIDIKTDNKELNTSDPRIVHLSLKPPQIDDISAPRLTKEPSWSLLDRFTHRRQSGSKRRDSYHPQRTEFSIDNGGALIALTIRSNGERTIAALMGMTREKSSHQSPLTEAAETVDTKSFVVENGSAKIHRKRSDQQPFKSSWRAQLGLGTEPVVADTRFTCWGCATVVGIACAGAATLSYSSCMSAALTSSVFSPWAFAAVGAFCTYVVSNAGTLSCAAGTAAICAGVTNDCSFLE